MEVHLFVSLQLCFGLSFVGFVVVAFLQMLELINWSQFDNFFGWIGRA